MTSKIYKITNLINNKIYIGYTRNTLEYRFKEHCYPKSKNAYKMPIVKAIQKYGKTNFKIELLEESENDKYIHQEREIYWIETLNAKNPNIGYNLAKGGNGGGFCYWNNGKINRRSETCPGKNFVRGMLVTEESHLLRSKVHKGCKSAFKGKTHTKEAKEKLSISHKGRFIGENNPSAKTIEIISPTGKKFIIKGNIKTFCQQNNLSFAMYKKYKNKGPCKANKFINKRNIAAKNTIGWTFNTIKSIK